MRSEDEDAQLNFRMAFEFAQGPVKMAVVGAGSGDNSDAAPRGSRWRLRRKAAAIRWILRRNHTRSIS